MRRSGPRYRKPQEVASVNEALERGAMDGPMRSVLERIPETCPQLAVCDDHRRGRMARGCLRRGVLLRPSPPLFGDSQFRQAVTTSDIEAGFIYSDDFFNDRPT